MTEVDDLDQREEPGEGKLDCRARMGAGLKGKMVVLLVGAE